MQTEATDNAMLLSSPDALSQRQPSTPTRVGPSISRKRLSEHGNTPQEHRPFQFTREEERKNNIQRAILDAQGLILKASLDAQGTEQQKELLELLDIFREYTEKKKVRQSTQILASQINNLETVQRNLEAAIPNLEAAIRNIPSPTSSIPSILKKSPSSYASVAARASTPSSRPSNLSSNSGVRVSFSNEGSPTTQQGEWQTVQSRSDSRKKEREEKRLILEVANPDAQVDPIQTRNQINEALGKTAVASVTRSRNNNIVLTTTTEYNADYLLQNQDKWETLTATTKARKDESWSKIIIHGIPIQPFDGPEGLQRITEEILTYNKDLDLHVKGTPFWITSDEKRKTQRAGSIGVALASDAEAARAMKYRLYIAGICARVEKMHKVAPTTQCRKCQGYGHLATRCTNRTTCGICAQSHDTKEHWCPDCQTGKACTHILAKCSNCLKEHTADTRTCEVFQALRHLHV